MEQFVKGGAFLIEPISPQEIFTPEDFNEEQRLVAKAVTEFVAGEIQPVADDIEDKKEGLLLSLLKKAGIRIPRRRHPGGVWGTGSG